MSSSPESISLGSTDYDWWISADQIFKSDVEGLEDFARIFKMEFNVEKISKFKGSRSFDSTMAKQSVKIYMGSGVHCAMIQGRLAKGVVIPKITIKKTTTIMGKMETLEMQEFSQCVIMSFSVVGDVVSFPFQYFSCSYTYTEFKEDGSQSGTAVAEVADT
ncbi:MAG: hypothetical protein LBF54_02945 [Holosporaceae bacterium]|jgi:hypothetical protein|nr:hypothetical protein [Holosporaceae bacterium]